MAIEQTLSIIKPDAVKKNIIGKIISRFESNGLHVVAGKFMHLTEAQAKGFYAEHEGRGFFDDLVGFMTSGPVFVQVLKGDNAVVLNRTLMGATDPLEAEADTLRKDFADSKSRNAVHGSDSLASAEREIAFFFDASDIVR